MVSTFGQVVTATLAAEAGGALGIAIDGRSQARLHNLVWGAAGTMLAVTCFDMLPEAYLGLGLIPLCLTTLSGAGLIAGMGFLSPSICPACDFGELETSAQPVMRNVWLITVALSIHCVLDGVGFVAADKLSTHHDPGLLIGLSFHKLPEGLALALLLLSAGFKKSVAMAWTFVTESFTLVGAGLVILFGTNFKASAVAIMVAFVGGGFLYLIVSALIKGIGSRHGTGRSARILAASFGFIATALIILLTR